MERFATRHQYETFIKRMRTFVRTRRALDRYDAFNAYELPNAMDGTIEESMAAVLESERLARNVGEVFGEDTADFNDKETCRTCVRPDEWLRKLVAL